MITYTKSQILYAVIDHMKTWDTGRPHLNDALMLSELETKIIGIIDLALPENTPEFMITDLPIYKEQPLGIGA